MAFGGAGTSPSRPVDDTSTPVSGRAQATCVVSPVRVNATTHNATAATATTATNATYGRARRRGGEGSWRWLMRMMLSRPIPRWPTSR